MVTHIHKWCPFNTTLLAIPLQCNLPSILKHYQNSHKDTRLLTPLTALMIIFCSKIGFSRFLKQYWGYPLRQPRLPCSIIPPQIPKCVSSKP